MPGRFREAKYTGMATDKLLVLSLDPHKQEQRLSNTGQALLFHKETRSVVERAVRLIKPNDTAEDMPTFTVTLKK